jgi:hypothetical protein
MVFSTVYCGERQCSSKPAERNPVRECVPEGAMADEMTIEHRQDESGKLTGRFVTSIALVFTNSTFNTETRMLLLEAQDLKTAKRYRLNGSIEQTESKVRWTPTS